MHQHFYNFIFGCGSFRTQWKLYWELFWLKS